ncbi:MAG: LTA synthase family protein, partial [Anaerotignum sp.]|nr:LTA synthase family protein [Anaerotignum sp.]
MKKIRIKKPDVKAGIHKLKTMRWKDVKAGCKNFGNWRKAKADAFRNSAAGRKLQALSGFMNRFSLIFHGIWAIIINYIIEAMSRHSVMAAWEFSRVSTKAFLYNAFMIFVTFSIVYLFKRRAFSRLILSLLWLTLGIVNGIMLSRRVTPFNAQDLKTVAEGLSLFTNYFSVKELVAIGIGAVLLVLFLIYLWKVVGKFKQKVNYALAGIVVAASFGGYGVLTDYVIENRIVSTYFANIAFAYQDYGLPYCFAASIFNTGISEPNGYTEEMVAEISHDGKMAESTKETDVLPNVIVVQLESFFDTSEYLALQTTKDPLPNLRKMAEEYSSGYCQVPTIGAGTANTEFEVITG